MKFIEKIEGADTIAIGGHVRPDGDCVGSCMGLFGYLADHYPEKKVCVYLEEIPEAFDYLKIEKQTSMICLLHSTVVPSTVWAKHRRSLKKL